MAQRAHSGFLRRPRRRIYVYLSTRQLKSSVLYTVDALRHAKLDIFVTSPVVLYVIVWKQSTYTRSAMTVAERYDIQNEKTLHKHNMSNVRWSCGMYVCVCFCMAHMRMCISIVTHSRGIVARACALSSSKLVLLRAARSRRSSSPASGRHTFTHTFIESLKTRAQPR